jgi:metal-sulfur cluster biosynthetic enzyme
VNIYDLGLIYAVEVSAMAAVVVTMTLTTPHCPVAESMPGEVELRVSRCLACAIARSTSSGIRRGTWPR